VRTRLISAALLVAAFIALGFWLEWSLLIAISLGVFFIFGIRMIVRVPKSATWWDIAVPTRVTRGDPASLTLGVSIGPGSTEWVSAVNDSGNDRVFIHARGDDLLQWSINTSLRGRFSVGPTLLEFAEPFGIYRKTLAEREPSSVLVVPRVHALSPIAITRDVATESGSERVGSETFESVREYVVGDPQKLVHWKSSARAGKLMVRRMVDTTSPLLLVVLDVNIKAYDRSGSLFDDFDADSFEESVETAASWAWHVCGSQERVLLTTTALAGSGAEAAVEVTIRNRESALDWLALIQPISEQSCGASRVEVLIKRHAPSRIIVVSGAQLDRASAWIRKWQSHAPVTPVVGHR